MAGLLRQVLRPLAEARGLTTWESVSAFAAAPWFPSRIAFGKFKDRPFREALEDQALLDWLRWLASANNARSAEMGRWYLEQIDGEAESTPAAPVLGEVGLSENSELVLFRDPELETLRQLVARDRARLADLEAEYMQEHHAVDVVQSELFTLLRPHYELRDALRLKVQHRRKYLDTLLIEDEDEAKAVALEYEKAKQETNREYEEAAADAAKRKALSKDEEKEIKTLFKKLARLYHPDRYAHAPGMHAIYERLMQEVNQARHRGNIERVREIVNDPNGFLLRQGLGSLDLSDEAGLAKLRQLYETLQARILGLLDELERLRKSGEYELYRLSRERSDFVLEVADQQAEEIASEIGELGAEAAQLAEEIEGLTGAEAPFRD